MLHNSCNDWSNIHTQLHIHFIIVVTCFHQRSTVRRLNGVVLSQLMFCTHVDVVNTESSIIFIIYYSTVYFLIIISQYMYLCLQKPLIVVMYSFLGFYTR